MKPKIYAGAHKRVLENYVSPVDINDYLVSPYAQSVLNSVKTPVKSAHGQARNVDLDELRRMVPELNSEQRAELERRWLIVPKDAE